MALKLRIDCLVAALAFLLLAAEPVTAFAQDDRARDAFENATQHYGEGRYADAQTAFERAFDLGGPPVCLYNAADAAERASNFQQAVALWQRYLRIAPESERSRAKQRLEQLRSRPSTVRINSEPLDAEVWIDGKPSSKRTPVELPLAPGDHRIELRAPGHASTGRQLHVEFGQPLELHLSLVPEATTNDAIAPGKLDIRSDPPGMVIVDGEQVGKSPRVVAIAPGTHRVEVRVEGHEPFVRQLAFEEGQTVVVEATLTVDQRWFRPSARLGVAVPVGTKGLGTGLETSLHTEFEPWSDTVGMGMNLDWAWMEGGGMLTAVPAVTVKLPLPQALGVRARVRGGAGLAYASFGGEPVFTKGESGNFGGMAFSMQLDMAVALSGAVSLCATPVGFDLVPAWFEFPRAAKRLHFNVGVGGDLPW